MNLPAMNCSIADKHSWRKILHVLHSDTKMAFGRHPFLLKMQTRAYQDELSLVTVVYATNPYLPASSYHGRGPVETLETPRPSDP